MVGTWATSAAPTTSPDGSIVELLHRAQALAQQLGELSSWYPAGLKHATRPAISASPTDVADTCTSQPVVRVAPPADEATPLRACPRRPSPLRDTSGPMASSRDSISPHTQSAHMTVERERRSASASTVRSRWPRATLATRNTLATAAIETKSRSTSIPSPGGPVPPHFARSRSPASVEDGPAAPVSSSAATWAPAGCEQARRTAGDPGLPGNTRVPLDGDDVLVRPLDPPRSVPSVRGVRRSSRRRR